MSELLTLLLAWLGGAVRDRNDLNACLDHVIPLGEAHLRAVLAE